MIDLIILSLKSLKRKKARTILTVLSVAIGVASVIIINIVSDAGIEVVGDELDSLGLGGLAVYSSAMNDDDVKNIENYDFVADAMPVISCYANVTVNGKKNEAYAWGVDDGADQVISTEVIYGRAVNPNDVSSNKNVCMMDNNLSKKFFGTENAVGKEISISIEKSSNIFTIIGIVKAESNLLESISGNFVPEFIYMPYTSLQLMTGETGISQIAIKLNENTDAESAADIISRQMTQITGKTIKTENMASHRSKLENLLETIKKVLGAIGAISVVVSGISIMNVMLVTVKEKTCEIGIKKSIGAKNRNILSEFLFESAFVSFLGGISGVILAIVLVIISNLAFSFSFSVPIMDILFTIIMASVIGAFFGAYPAVKAAKLSPIEALRR